MGYSGAGGKLIHEKTRSKKSHDTVPLSTFRVFLHFKRYMAKKVLPPCARVLIEVGHCSTRARIFKRLWSPEIDSKEWIPPAHVASGPVR